MTDEVLATVEASTPRRWFATGVLWVLAMMLIWLALAQPPAPGWQAFLIVFGAVAAYGAESLRRATLNSVVLTEDAVADSSGREIARLDNVLRVDRGAFAFKPSNGFLLVLKTRGPRAWAPGLWWRMGRRVGVGGVTSANASKMMAEKIALMIAQRDKS